MSIDGGWYLEKGLEVIQRFVYLNWKYRETEIEGNSVSLIVLLPGLSSTSFFSFILGPVILDVRVSFPIEIVFAVWSTVVLSYLSW